MKLATRKFALVAALGMACAGFGYAPIASAFPVYVDVQATPPPPRYEVVPAARPGFVWAPGHWRWDGYRYVWIGGYWTRVRPGYVYRPARWVPYGGNYRYYPGYWVAG